MSDFWLNAFHGYSCDIYEQPKCNRSTQLGNSNLDCFQDNSMSWKSLEEHTIPDSINSLFRVLKPHFRGVIANKEMEEKVLHHGYEWMSLMVNAEDDREVFEAAILISCVMPLVEGDTAQAIADIGVLEEIEVYGYTVHTLLHILGRVLIPTLIKRLKHLMVACIQEQERRKFPDLQERTKMCVKMKSSYDKYLRFRNMDGFFEGGLIVSLAAAGQSGESLKFGVMCDIVESAIHSHDSHGIIRHFAEEDIANMHRYAPGGISETLSRSFLRNALLNQHTHHSELSPGLKRALLNYSSGYYIFPYACLRYGYGSTYCKAVDFYLKQ
ncbi:hypothetical protein DSO57_1001131 [Entomophthora muscae]|uniref:Uncharacterized protein n=1 Tax=Entomophthora muscae TaxID=34485 RepID=A0ACC2RZY9_9FUNG|nr:hypothetical protein DSO57_1001131 [Entomophthora muscae]